jgi:hypothetical protein
MDSVEQFQQSPFRQSPFQRSENGKDSRELDSRETLWVQLPGAIAECNFRAQIELQ